MLLIWPVSCGRLLRFFTFVFGIGAPTTFFDKMPFSNHGQTVSQER
jgi:hypothetical protein